jgi:hypothetical protein
MYIKLLIILYSTNLPLFALRLFDCENSHFWNPLYFILQNKYIIIVLIFLFIYDVLTDFG